MGWMSKIGGGLIAPVAKIFEKREDRKKVVNVIKATAAAAEVDGKVAVALSKAEWEIISKNSEPTTWKDEYITLLITSPFLTIFAGAFMSVFFDDTRLLTATSEALGVLKELGVDMGELMLYTVLAAIGIKAVK